MAGRSRCCGGQKSISPQKSIATTAARVVVPQYRLRQAPRILVATDVLGRGIDLPNVLLG